MDNFPSGFWKIVALVGGVAGIALALFWSLFGKIVEKIVLASFGELNSFRIVVILIAAISFITALSVYMYFKTKQIPSGNGVTYSIPQGWNFRKAAFAMAQEDGRLIRYEGFTEAELDSPIAAQMLETSTTRIALGMLINLATTPIRPYDVVQGDGVYTLRVR